MGMIPSAIGYRSGIGLNAAVTSRLLKKAHMLRCARPISRQRTTRVRLRSSIFVRLAFEIFLSSLRERFQFLL